MDDEIRFEELVNRLDTHIQDDAQLRVAFAKIDTKLDNVAERVEKLTHALLDGNGQPSIMVRVALIEDQLKRVVEERNDDKVPRAAWLAILLSTIVGAAAVIVAVIK